MRRIAIPIALAAVSALVLKAQQNMGPINSPQVNSTIYVGAVSGFNPTIQAAVTSACTTTSKRVIDIPVAYAGSDTIAALTGGCSTATIRDERSLPVACYSWSGSAYTVAGCASSSGSIGTPSKAATYDSNGNLNASQITSDGSSLSLPSTGQLGIGNSATPPAATDGTDLSTELVVNPQTSGAVNDATWSDSTNILTGTNNRLAFMSAYRAAKATGRTMVIPAGNWRTDKPGGVLTNVAIDGSNNGTFTIPGNTLQVGDYFTPLCVANATYLNGVEVLVRSVSGDVVTGTFHHSTVASTAITGGLTTAGRGSWNPIGCPTGSAAYAASPMLQVDSRYLKISGHNANIFGLGTGPFVQYDHDKTVQITSISSDSSGNVTATFDAMPDGHTFVAGESLIVANTGTALDATYGAAQVTAVTATSVTLTGASPSLAALQGVIHEPWTNFDADGQQNQEIDDVQFYDYNRANLAPVNMDSGSFGTQAGTACILDYRGGNIVLQRVRLQGCEYGFFGPQSDINTFVDVSGSGNRVGNYFGPFSTPIHTVTNYNDYGVGRSMELDGVGSQGNIFDGGHYRSGNSTTSAFGIVNRQYDTTAANGGGVVTQSVILNGVDFEAGIPGGVTTCQYAAKAFISVDADPGAVTPTADVTLNGVSIVNVGAGATNCNVPYLTQIGPQLNGATPYLKLNVDSTTLSSLAGWNHNLSSANPTINYTGKNPALASLPISTDSGSGVSTVFPIPELPVDSPTFTNILTGPNYYFTSPLTSGAPTPNISWGCDGLTSGSHFCYQNSGTPPRPIRNGYTAAGGLTSQWDPAQGFFVYPDAGGSYRIYPSAGTTVPANLPTSSFWVDSAHKLHFYDDTGTDHTITWTP